MSAFWVNIYLKTAIPMTDVFTQTYEVARRVLNTKLESVRLTDSQEAERVKSAYAQKQIVVFPEKNGLVSFNLPRFSASAYLMDLSPEMASDGMMSGEMKQLLSLAEEISQAFAGELALVFYDRNPSGDVTVIRFYKVGEFLGQYYGADGDLFEFHQPENPDAIDQLLDGRFSFVNAALEYEDDDEEFPLVIHASHFEDANNAKLASAHLFLPSMSKNLLPYGTIVVNE